MHRRALTRRKKMLGSGHPDILTSISHLGLVLQGQGKYEESETMHRRALARDDISSKNKPCLPVVSGILIIARFEFLGREKNYIDLGRRF